MTSLTVTTIEAKYHVGISRSQAAALHGVLYDRLTGSAADQQRSEVLRKGTESMHIESHERNRVYEDFIQPYEWLQLRVVSPGICRAQC